MVNELLVCYISGMRKSKLKKRKSKRGALLAVPEDPQLAEFEVDRKNELRYIQQAFVYEYLIDFDVQRCAKTIGQSVIMCNRWLHLPLVREELSKRMLERARRKGISADYIIDKLAAILETSLDDFLVIPEFGTPYYDLAKATPAQRAVLEAVEITSRVDIYDSNKGTVHKVLKTKLVMPSKLKALELLGKHVDVQAFRERIDVTMHSVEERLTAGRKRACLQGEVIRVDENDQESKA